MTKVYIAGDMLKKGSQLLRAEERKALEDIDGISVFNPADQKDINDKTKNPTAEAIFAKDTTAILESNIIIFDADNDSVGTTTEVGQVWGINYMRKRLVGILDNAANEGLCADEVLYNIRNLLEEIPYKNVHWHNSDIRNVKRASETGLRRSFSLNQYLHGCLLDMDGEDKSFGEIVDLLKGGK
ncbi:nucleoside 2-deoxyribosyltransferase [Bacillus proteolyticus]|uniref:nucleoside 2-deoxyribosyltransferase n=1 Tax=Bacillus cereus group TaxID=86661 RepID=UPI002E2126EF|nr:nucleoside 2-deoxyribosyltransferase [Bacillus mycoides]